jgi:hypothetical protein
MSLVPVGPVQFYVLDLADKGVKMLPLSKGQYDALRASTSFAQLRYLFHAYTEEEAMAYMSDFTLAMDAIKRTDLVELLGLSE